MQSTHLTKLTTKGSAYFRSAVFVWYYMLSALHHCTRVFQHGGPWNGCFWPIHQHLSAPSLPSMCPLITQCDRCLEDYVEAHGWAVRIASHGSIILSGAWLVTVEAPGYPRHPSSIQHDAVVKKYQENNFGTHSAIKISQKCNTLFGSTKLCQPQHKFES